MSLNPGARIGPYEVVSPLGAGGMGEVWRARDPRLGRDVALKVLPPDVASDPERLARFAREAQLLASLNHANIAAIYGLEEAGGIVHRDLKPANVKLTTGGQVKVLDFGLAKALLGDMTAPDASRWTRREPNPVSAAMADTAAHLDRVLPGARKMLLEF